MKTISEHIKPFIDEDFGTTSMREIERVLYMRTPAVSPREKAIIEMQDLLLEMWAD